MNVNPFRVRPRVILGAETWANPDVETSEGSAGKEAIFSPKRLRDGQDFIFWTPRIWSCQDIANRAPQEGRGTSGSRALPGATRDGLQLYTWVQAGPTAVRVPFPQPGSSPRKVFTCPLCARLGSGNVEVSQARAQQGPVIRQIIAQLTL